MSSDFKILLAVMTLWVVGAIGIILFVAIRRYRIDLKPNQSGYEGDSTLPILNYLSPGNYSREGMRLLRWFWVWHIAIIAVAATAAWLILTMS